MTTRTRSKGSRTTGSAGWIRAEQSVGDFKHPTIGVLPVGTVRYTNNNPVENAWPYVNNTLESMTDVIGNKGGINPINHSRKDVTHGGIAPLKWSAKDTVRGGLVRFEQTDYPTTYYADQQLQHAIVDDGMAVAVARIPMMGKEALSGLNSLYELKDVAHALRRIPVHLVWSIWRHKLNTRGVEEAIIWVEDSIKDIRRSPAQFLKGLIGLDLAWKFGWAPLIQDIQTVHSALGEVDQKLQKLLTEPFTVAGRFTQEITDFGTCFTGGDADPYRCSNADCLYSRSTRRTDVAGVRRTLSPTAFNHIDAIRLAQIRESLGLTLEARDVWAAMPLSFVVDWFIPVSNFIEQFSSHTPSDSWFVTQAQWQSTKTTTTGRIRYTRLAMTAPDITVSGLPGEVESGFSYSTYSRIGGAFTVPPLFLPRTRLPSLGQWWTGVELAFQRMVKSTH